MVRAGLGGRECLEQLAGADRTGLPAESVCATAGDCAGGWGEDGVGGAGVGNGNGNGSVEVSTLTQTQVWRMLDASIPCDDVCRVVAD